MSCARITLTKFEPNRISTFSEQLNYSYFWIVFAQHLTVRFGLYKGFLTEKNLE